MRNIQDTIEIVGGIGAPIVIIILGLFGINSIPVEFPLLLFLVGLLANSLRLDHKLNQSTSRAAEKTLSTIQDLNVNQANTQQMIQNLDTSARSLDANQSSLERSLQVLSGSVKSLTRNKFYSDQDEAYKCLLEYIDRHTVTEAIFLQYSCKQSEILLYPLVLNKKARATVFIQHEDMPGQLQSKRQVDRITSTIRNSLSDLSRKLSDLSHLKVYKFKTPASLRAIKIDDQVLCVGWYTYEKVDRKGYSTFSDDQIAVSGHDRPTIVVWRGTEEFDVLDQMVSVMVKNYQENGEEVQL